MQLVGPLAFSVGGSALGSFLGGPIGGAIGGTIGGVVGGMLFHRQRKPLIGDTQLGNSTYGNPIPILYGTARLPGHMIWQTQVQTKATGLLKGANKHPYSYHQSAALMFCYGPAKLIKIWLDGKLFWDSTAQFPGEITKHTFAIRSYNGTATQLPDYLIADWVRQYVDTPQAVPAYRDLCYIVIDGIDLAYYGTRFPVVTMTWSAVAESTSFFSQVTPLSPDVSSDASAHSMAVDWIRGVIYTLSTDRTVRVFDLATGVCLQARTIAEIFAPTGALGVWEAINYVPNSANVAGIVCGNGGLAYLWISDGYPSYQNLIFTLDPNTLTITQVIKQPVPGAIWSLICWTTPYGDTLAGSLYGDFTGNNEYAFVLSPSFYVDPAVTASVPLWLSAMPPSLVGSGGENLKFAVSPSDAASGATTLYFTNAGDSVLAGGSIPLSIVTLVNAVISDITGPLLLTAATFGVAAAGGPYSPITAMQYDPVDGTLILYNVPWGVGTAKINPTTLAVLWMNSAAPQPSGQLVNTDVSAGTAASSFNAGAGSISIIDTQTGLISVSPIGGADAARGTNHANTPVPVYNSQAQTLVYTEGGLPWIVKLMGTTSSDVTVASILTDLCGRVGVTPDMIDVSRVTQTTVGYVLASNKSCGAALQDLCNVYQIDIVESDYLLTFVPRGAVAVATIPQADLMSVDGADQSQFWQVTHAQEEDMPLQVDVKYSDPDLDYQPGAAYSRRTALPVPTIYSKRKMTIDLPVVVSNLAARAIADALLWQTWAGRDVYETALSPKYLWLDPTDNVTVTLDNGDSYTARIESIETGADLTLKLRLGSEDQTVYVPAANTTGVTYGIGQQTLVPGGFASLLLCNVPLLQDGDAVGAGFSRIYYAAGASNATAWRGGLVSKSTDGVNWDQTGQLPNGANWGRAINALGDTVAKFCTDHVNTVRIRFVTGATLPSSCAYVDLMNGANAALLGSEIIQFQTVNDNADGSVTLTDLVRSRRGTDWASGTHVAGEAFILLQPGLVAGNAISTGEIGVSELWELAPAGSAATLAAAQRFSYLGYDLFPYAPVHLARTQSGSDLVLSWVRRTRIGGGLVDGSDSCPLNEETEAYDAYLITSSGALAAFNPANAGTYVRAFTGLTAPTVTYTAAMMTADSFTPATGTLFLAVYQLSAVVGRGFQSFAALPAF